MAKNNYICEGCGKQFKTLPELQEHVEQCPEVQRLESSPKTRSAGGTTPNS